MQLSLCVLGVLCLAFLEEAAACMMLGEVYRGACPWEARLQTGAGPASLYYWFYHYRGHWSQARGRSVLLSALEEFSTSMMVLPLT